MVTDNMPICFCKCNPLKLKRKTRNGDLEAMMNTMVVRRTVMTASVILVMIFTTDEVMLVLMKKTRMRMLMMTRIMLIGKGRCWQFGFLCSLSSHCGSFLPQRHMHANMLPLTLCSSDLTSSCCEMPFR